MLSSELRQAVAAEARTWIGTPYHRKAAIKGVGVDCGMLPYAVLRKFDLIPEFKPKMLFDDWFCHTGDQEYLIMVQRYLRVLVAGQARRDTKVPVGALVLAKVAGSKVYNHSGIATRWPMVVHASYSGVVEINAALDHMWSLKEIQVCDAIKD